MTRMPKPAVYNIRDYDSGTDTTVNSTSHSGAAEDYAREAWKKHKRGSYSVGVSDGGKYRKFVVRVETVATFSALQVTE
jgi:hypothetical protein